MIVEIRLSSITFVNNIIHMYNKKSQLKPLQWVALAPR